MSDNALTAYRQARDKQLVRNEARHIRSKINDARGSRHDAGVRWPFELLQNALDAGPRSGRDRVQLHLRQSGGIFALEHDGAFFTLKDLAALLSGGSSKEFDSEDTTGRFGTGFLVTHVLTTQTTVSGILATGVSLERFELTIDRSGDEDSIVANIGACDAAIQCASPLVSSDQVSSASFKYITDDAASLHLGLNSFKAALPYLFATCERLGRVTIDVEGDLIAWESEPPTRHTANDLSVYERRLFCRCAEGVFEYRAVRVAASSSPNQAAVAVLLHVDGGWQLQLLGNDFPRLFCKYPIRSSTFLPIHAVLDAPFDLDQERRRILLDKEEVRRIFHATVNAVVPLVLLAYEEGWINRHWLAHAAPSPSSFAAEDEQETSWLTSQMAWLASRLAQLPLVETRNGLGVSVEVTDSDWYADFVDVHSDGITMNRLWSLVDDAEELFPPVVALADAWGTIASGWQKLGVQVKQVGLGVLAEAVRGDAEDIGGLRVRCDKRTWLTRFFDVVGECWAQHGVNVGLIERLIPSQSGTLVPLKNLKRDDGIPESLKEIADSLGCGVRSRLVDLAISEIAREKSLNHVQGVMEAAVPHTMTEDDVLNECIRLLDRRFPETERFSDSNRELVQASIRLLDFLAHKKGDATKPLAERVPLLAHDGVFARASSQRKMVSPVETWDERARAFAAAYPPDRVLAAEYVGTNVVAALVGWGIAFAAPLTRITPADPVKGDRLRCLVSDGADTEGVQVSGVEFTQIALLHELLPRCQHQEEAASLLGLALCYMSQVDTSWRETRVVNGRRSGDDTSLTVIGALWLADLRARPWVPVRSEEGKTSQVVPTPESLKSLLDPTWLRGNADALELLGNFFGFDALDLQLLAAPDDESRQGIRDSLARIVELAGGNPQLIDAVRSELEAAKMREKNVARCRMIGLNVQEAIQRALEAKNLTVKVIDVGFDFDVSCEGIDDAASTLEVDSFLVEVKATTQSDAKLTPKQAETASQKAERYVLCVVDLRGVPDERLDGPWSAEDVRSLARLVPQIGTRVKGTWALVEKARTNEVVLRNEGALRYAVRSEVWGAGCSIDEWVARAFRVGAPS